MTQRARAAIYWCRAGCDRGCEIANEAVNRVRPSDDIKLDTYVVFRNIPLEYSYPRVPGVLQYRDEKVLHLAEVPPVQYYREVLPERKEKKNY